MRTISVIRWVLRKTIPFPVREFLRMAFWRMIGRDDLSFFREAERNGLRLAPVCDGPQVSILCCVWNTRPAFLRQMLHSIRKQSYRNWELVVDDCSDSFHPETGAVLMRFAAADARIKVRKTINRGIALNTNAAADRAAGDFILLMDHDDMLLPDALEHLIRAQEAEHADFVYSDEYYFQMPYHVVWHRHKKPFSMRKLEEENYINHPALIRKSLFLQIGGLRPGFEGAQDHDLYLRLFEKTSRIAYVPGALYVWRLHPDSFSHSSIQRCAEAGKKALEEHFRRMNVAAIVECNNRETIYRVRFPNKRRS